MKKESVNDQSTIYNYTLVKRLAHGGPFGWAYAVLALASLLYGLIQAGAGALAAWMFSILFMAACQAALLRMIPQMTGNGRTLSWGMYGTPFFFGPYPKMNIGYSVYRRLQFHLFVVGCGAIGIGYVWIPKLWFWYLLSAHILLLLPRVRLVWSFRKLKKPGLLKIGPHDTSYYLP